MERPQIPLGTPCIYQKKLCKVIGYGAVRGTYYIRTTTEFVKRVQGRELFFLPRVDNASFYEGVMKED